MLVAVSSYASGVLKFGIENRLPGNETEIFTAIGWFLHTSLVENHQLPLWNPYLHTGLPYLGDPMLYIYNPLVSIPVILWGGWDGFKIGVFLSFLVAALGMLWLCKVLGLGRLASLWAALIYTFAGQPVARFFQGEYLFVFGFAWIPWIVAALFQVIQTQHRRYIILLALFLALLYMSGNAYYPFLMLFVIALFLFSYLFLRKKERPFIQLDKNKLKRMVVAGILALGLISVQLLPNIEFWPHMRKGLGAYGSQTLRQIYLDYTSKDTLRPDAYADLPAREEYYAYIGIAPFLALALLPLAFQKRYYRLIIFLLLVVSFVVVYIDLKAMPWQDFYEKSRFFSQFRHLLRPLIFGSFAILLLGALGLDTAWKFLGQRAELSNNGQLNKSKFMLSLFARVLLLIFVIIAIWDVYATNKIYARTEQMPMPPVNAARWLRQYDAKAYYTLFNPNNAGLYGLLSNHLRFIDAWYHWNDIRDLAGDTSVRQVKARPNYVIQASNNPRPEGEGVQLVQQVEGLNIYYLPQSLPFAFTVDSVLLETHGPELSSSMVEELLAITSKPGKIELIASGKPQQTLVVLTTGYPGWRVSVDGNEQPLLNVGGYLAVDMLEGAHKYLFSYHPIPFYIGLVLSLASLAICLTILVVDLHPEYASFRLGLTQTYHDLSGAIGRRRKQWQQALASGRFSSSATYRANQLELDSALPLNDGSRVQLEIEALPVETSPLRNALHRWLLSSEELISQAVHAISLAGFLFICALLLYLIIRLWRLVDFPLYFFTDEAIQTLSAADLIKNDFRSPDGILLPTFFKNGPYYNLSLSVYLQIIPYLLFGKSVFVTRAVSVLFTLMAAISISLSLRDFYKVKYWWAGVLVLSLTPSWFLHSRTAFETVIFVSCYAGFLFSYLLYRCRSPRYIYLSLVMAGLAFYSYSPGQLVIAATGIALLFLDLRYHWENRKMARNVLIVLALIALPYLRFRFGSTFSPTEHLQLLNSYWIQPISLGEKLGRFWTEYSHGLSINYWFIPNQNDLERHLMKGYGNLPIFTLPFFIAGIIITIWNIRKPAYRVLLVALLAAPLGSSLVGIGITRTLVFVVPATMLIVIGIGYCLDWFEKVVNNFLSKRSRLPANKNTVSSLMSIGLFSLLLLANILLARDALVNGPRWFSNYGLGGMQYGATQLFPAVTEYQKSHPEAGIIVSPNWANGTDVLARFFSTEDVQYKLGSIDGYLYEQKPLDENTVFVMIPDEYNKAFSSGKFKDIQIDQTLPYPNGQPGFYFVRLQYTDDIAEMLSSEEEARNALQQAEVMIDGEPVQVQYSLLDMGTIELVFDGDKGTVARTMEANPFIIELIFPEARQLSGYKMFLGSADMRVTAILYPEEGGQSLGSVAEFDGSPSNPELDVNFGETQTAQKVRFEVLQPYTGVPSNVHIWEIEFK